MNKPADPNEVPATSIQKKVLANLCCGQLVCWGVIVYAFPVLAASMCTEFGMSQASGVALISIALTIMACSISTNIRLIRRFGPRVVVSGGAFVAAAFLFSWAVAPNYWVAACCWAGIGFAMAGILHENCFIVIHDIFGARSGKPLSVLTTISAFASTIFIPAAVVSVRDFGWRNTAVLMGAVVLAYGISAFLGLPRNLKQPIHLRGSPSLPVLREHPDQSAPTQRGVRLLAVSFGLHALVASALWMSLIRLLGDKGVSLSVATLVVGVIGPSQVVSRIIQYYALDFMPTALIGVLAFTTLPIATILFALSTKTSFIALFAFAVLFGAANGLIVMARGMAPIIFFSRDSYSTITGKIGTLVAVGRAAGPYALAVAISAAGTAMSVTALACISSLAGILYLRPHLSHQDIFQKV